jgi:membrane associated rhomboid family serine protease
LTPHELREALLRALAFDNRGQPRRGARLLRYDAEEAALLLSVSGECVVSRAVEEGDGAALEALRARLAVLEEAARGSQLNVVVLGGGDAARRVLKEAGSFWGRSPLTLFHVTGEGRLWCNRFLGRGPNVVGPVLKQGLKRAVAGGPLSASERAVLLPDEREAPRDHGAEPSAEAVFWTTLARRTPWACWAIGVVVVILFVLEMAWGGSESALTLYRMGANVPERVRAGEVFRLFSSAFLHIGVPHLVINLWALRVVGPFLEKILGTARFIILYALSALAGNVASVAIGRAHISAGASGALWGIMVASFALALWPRGLLPDGVRRVVKTQGWQPLAVNFVYSFMPRIDLFAHFGGGLAGGLLVATGALTRGLERPGTSAEAPRHDGVATALAALLSLLMVGSVIAALVVGRPWEEPWELR